jgi:hypothetical protein
VIIVIRSILSIVLTLRLPAKHMAAQNGHLGIVNMLYQAGADVNATFRTGT